MSKIISVLEKFNLVEKTDVEKEDVEAINDKNDVIKEHFKEEIIEGDKQLNKIEKVKSAEENSKTKIEKDLQSKDVNYNKEIHKVDSNYEKNMNINEIYSLYNLDKDNINTVFILDSYINALPKNLPQNLVKDSVLNILKASNINLDKLLSDGQERLKNLNEFMGKHSDSAHKSIKGYKEEIIKLQKLIENYENNINKKQELLEEQENLVKYEMERINGIIDFFNK